MRAAMMLKAMHFSAKQIKLYLVFQNIRVSRLLCMHSFVDTFPTRVPFSPAAFPRPLACLAGVAFLWQAILRQPGPTLNILVYFLSLCLSFLGQVFLLVLFAVCFTAALFVLRASSGGLFACLRRLHLAECMVGGRVLPPSLSVVSVQWWVGGFCPLR